MFKFQSVLAPAITVALVACGARFTAHESDGAPADNAGEASGGFTSAVGGSGIANAGEAETGGSNAAGTTSTAGAGGTVTETGGTTGVGGSSAGRSGWGSGGWWSGYGGAASAAQCASLRQDYETAVEQARACDKGSTDQCSPSSVAELISGCGCPTLINTSSADAVKKAYQAYLDAKCERGAVCNIACQPAPAATCSQSTTSGTFVCTGDGLQK